MVTGGRADDGAEEAGAAGLGQRVGLGPAAEGEEGLAGEGPSMLISGWLQLLRAGPDAGCAASGAGVTRWPRTAGLLMPGSACWEVRN